jgi:hypothetical protein
MPSLYRAVWRYVAQPGQQSQPPACSGLTDSDRRKAIGIVLDKGMADAVNGATATP